VQAQAREHRRKLQIFSQSVIRYADSLARKREALILIGQKHKNISAEYIKREKSDSTSTSTQKI
jgi:hypothetical protein